MPQATIVALAGWLHGVWWRSMRMLSTSAIADEGYTTTTTNSTTTSKKKKKKKTNTTTTNTTSTTPIKKSEVVPKYTSLHLSDETYKWIKAMACEHSAGSVHKAIRDLFSYAVSECGSDEDLDFLFKACSHHRRRRTSITTTTNNNSSISLHEVAIRLNSLKTQAWITHCIHMYRLKDISHLFTILSHVVIDLDAAKDVFASLETAVEPRKSADLYYDLGIVPKPS